MRKAVAGVCLFLLAIVAAPLATFAQPPILTQHYDNARDG